MMPTFTCSAFGIANLLKTLGFLAELGLGVAVDYTKIGVRIDQLPDKLSVKHFEVINMVPMQIEVTEIIEKKLDKMFTDFKIRKISPINSKSIYVFCTKHFTSLGLTNLLTNIVVDSQNNTIIILFFTDVNQYDYDMMNVTATYGNDDCTRNAHSFKDVICISESGTHFIPPLPLISSGNNIITVSDNSYFVNLVPGNTGLDYFLYHIDLPAGNYTFRPNYNSKKLEVVRSPRPDKYRAAFFNTDNSEFFLLNNDVNLRSCTNDSVNLGSKQSFPDFSTLLRGFKYDDHDSPYDFMYFDNDKILFVHRDCQNPKLVIIACDFMGCKDAEVLIPDDDNALSLLKYLHKKFFRRNLYVENLIRLIKNPDSPPVISVVFRGTQSVFIPFQLSDMGVEVDLGAAYVCPHKDLDGNISPDKLEEFESVVRYHNQRSTKCNPEIVVDTLQFSDTTYPDKLKILGISNDSCMDAADVGKCVIRLPLNRATANSNTYGRTDMTTHNTYINNNAVHNNMLIISSSLLPFILVVALVIIILCVVYRNMDKIYNRFSGIVPKNRGSDQVEDPSVATNLVITDDAHSNDNAFDQDNPSGVTSTNIDVSNLLPTTKLEIGLNEAYVKSGPKLTQI